MGCGKRNFGTDWKHIDGGDYSHLDSHDITKLEYQDDSVDLIYSSHVIEYFDREEVIDVLTEWKRVLKPNGTLRLAVPDFQSMVELYINANYPLETFLGPMYGKMDMGDQKIYHKTVYDFMSLKSLLKKLGFKSIKKYDWQFTEHNQFDDQSRAYIPNDLDAIAAGIFPNHTLISLNVECIK